MTRHHLAGLLLFLTACSADAPPREASTDRAPSALTPSESPDRSSSTPPPVQGPKLAFIDEGPKDADFAAFRQQLLEAVGRRDRAAVLDLAHPNIRTSFGADGGRADLGRNLDRDPELWQELQTILSMGGTFRDGGGKRAFWAPYVYSVFPEDRDAFTTFAVIADAVPLREKPSADSRTVAILSRDLVTGEPGESVEWIEVQTIDGRKGWVEKTFVRSPVDYRAGFGKTDQGWRMDALVAGD